MSLSEIDKQCLMQCRLWNVLPEEQADSLFGQCSVLTYSKGQLVFSEGEQSDFVLFVLSGELRACVNSPDGKEVTYRLLPALSVVGDFSAIDQQPRSATVVAESATVVVKVNGDVFRKTLREQPEFALSELTTLVTALREISTAFYQHEALPLADRLYDRLLSIAVRGGQACGDSSWQLSSIPKHRQLATHLNATREAITRAFKLLQRDGLIERQEDGSLIIFASATAALS